MVFPERDVTRYLELSYTKSVRPSCFVPSESCHFK
jgi:hypothetical protein